MWEAGQLVTIGRAVYRVVRDKKPGYTGGCSKCAFNGNLYYEEPCASYCLTHMYWGYHLKRIIPKICGNQVK